MKLARPDVFHPRIVLAGCPALPEGDGDDAGLVAALRARGLHARWLSWDDPATLDADLVILRATWDYTDRLDEFLDWTRQVPHLLNAPQVVAWNADKRYLADLSAAGVPTVPRAFFAPGEQVAHPVRRGGGQARGRCGFGWRAAVHRSAAGPRARRFAARARPHRAGAALRSHGSATGRPRWCSSAVRSRTRSPRARCCRRRGSRPHSTNRAPTPRNGCSRPTPISSCGTSGTPRWPRRRTGARLQASELLYARVDIIGGGRRSAAAGTGTGRAVAGLASARRAASASRQQRQFALGGRVSAGAIRARSALASTPIAPRSPPCRPPHPRRAGPPTPRAPR